MTTNNTENAISPPDDLRPWGYAPGFYSFQCKDCPEAEEFCDRAQGDKRSSRCRDHAIEAWRQGGTENAMGGVTITEATVRHFLDQRGVDLAAPENFPGRAGALVKLMAIFGAAVDRNARIAARQAALEEVRPLIEELANDLEAEVKDNWCYVDGAPHPALQHKYDRDMVPVNAARAFLATLSTKEVEG